MTASRLAQSYCERATKRLKILEVLVREGAYSDVVREAQEVVELAEKAMLRQVGVEPPKYHDVGPILLEHALRFPEDVRSNLPKLAEISGWLRKEREQSFYGDVDFVPTERYSLQEAKKAIEDATLVVGVATGVVNREPSS